LLDIASLAGLVGLIGLVGNRRRRRFSRAGVLGCRGWLLLLENVLDFSLDDLTNGRLILHSSKPFGFLGLGSFLLLKKEFAAKTLDTLTDPCSFGSVNLLRLSDDGGVREHLH